MNYSLLSADWSDYELIDSGDGEKLERFGRTVLIRPEPKALWSRTEKAPWSKAVARYVRSSEGGGHWKYYTQLPSSWTLRWEDVVFEVRPTGFKHTGVFPEQVSIWKNIRTLVTGAKRQVNVLNLFAYTGGSTLAALSAGAKVTHVDSVKDMVDWAHRNAELSGLDKKPVRWIVDDAIKYVKREIKRGMKYDAVIMDPPKFGRGSHGEVWKIEKDLPSLLELCGQLLAPDPLFFLVNAYDVSYTAVSLRNIVSQQLSHLKGSVDFGELTIKPTHGNMLLSTSIYAMYTPFAKASRVAI